MRIFLFVLVSCGFNSRYILVKIEESRSLDLQSGDISERSLSGFRRWQPRGKHPNQHLVDNKRCGIGRVGARSRIIGGKYAVEGEFPWMALIAERYTNGSRSPYYCGGSLITKSWVLTASHCLFDYNGVALSRVTVLLGHYSRYDTANAIMRDANKMILHEKYDNEALMPENDIGLIKLAGPAVPLTGSVKVNTICLPLNYSNPEIKKARHVTVAGHGATAVKSFPLHDHCEKEESWPVNDSARMKKFTTQLVDTYDCKNRFVEYEKKHCNYPVPMSPRKNLCAGGEVDQDSCAGDSGGPLMIKDTKTRMRGKKKKAWIQVGIVSWGIAKCGTEGMPGVYTNVLYYLKWILDKLD